MIKDKSKFTVRITDISWLSEYNYELRVIGPVGETRHRKKYKGVRGVRKACQGFRDAGYTVPDAEWNKIALD
mgnify:CR=1 FL=1